MKPHQHEPAAGIIDVLRFCVGVILSIAIGAVIGGLIGVAIVGLVSLLRPAYPALRIQTPDGTSCRTESPPGEPVNPWRDPCRRSSPSPR